MIHDKTSEWNNCASFNEKMVQPHPPRKNKQNLFLQKGCSTVMNLVRQSKQTGFRVLHSQLKLIWSEIILKNTGSDGP